MKIHKYMLEVAVFVCGAVVMIFELVGSRVLGPYFGTSIFVWTSLIGVILGSLSLGYYIGGQLADKRGSLVNLAWIIFLSSVFIGLTVIIKDSWLEFLQANIVDIRISSIPASVVLFAPASALLGMVSPYAAKLKIKDIYTSGSAVGNLYALSTIGSIAGTFLAGYYLIPRFGTNKLLVMLAAALIIVSIVISEKRFIKIKIAALLVVLSVWVLIGDWRLILEKNGFIDVDTAYNRIWIFNRQDKKTNKLVKVMGINGENHSSMFLDSDELVNEYTKYYHLARHFKPGFKEALMFGGAGYSFPKNFLLKYPRSTLDVVEIDPTVTRLAQKYFKLKEDSRLKIYHADGRVYLNRAGKKYDVIFGDAFSSHYSLPYQLTTREAVQKEYDILNDGGVVVINIISAIEGRAGQFLRAEFATYKSVFPQVYLFPVKEAANGQAVQNIMLVALKSDEKPIFKSSDSELNGYLAHLWTKEVFDGQPILTDDYAPVDYYISQAL